MADYVTSDDFEAFAHEPTALDGTAMEMLLTAASRLFDKHCEVTDDFFAAATGVYSDRTFIGDGTAYLKLPPYVSLALTNPVAINEGTIDDEDFITDNVPEYAEQNGMLIVLDRTKWQREEAASYPGRFEGWPDGKQIEVTADWGFAAIPKDVRLACTHLALHLWRTADPAFARISGAETAAVAATTIPEVAQMVIDRYREKYSKRFIFA